MEKKKSSTFDFIMTLILYWVAGVATMLASLFVVLVLAFLLLTILGIIFLCLVGIAMGVVLLGIGISKFFVIPRGAVCISGLGICLMGGGIAILALLVWIFWSIYISFNKQSFKLIRKKEKEEGMDENIA